MRNPRRPLTALALLASGLLASCGGSESPPPTTAANQVTATSVVRPVSTGPTSLAIYVTQHSGELLIRTPISETSQGPKRYERLLTRLAESTDSPIPRGTTIRSARTRGDVLVIDFSTRFASGYPTGGAAAENLILGAIVFSVTRSYPEIRAVQILVDGAPADVSTQYDLSGPISVDDLPGDLVGEE